MAARPQDENIQMDKLDRDNDEDYDDREDAGLMADSAQRPPAPAPSSSSLKGLSLAAVADSKPLSILAYCLSSISMTVVNKYVVSGDEWNLTSLYLAAQVCSLPLTATHGCRSALTDKLWASLL